MLLPTATLYMPDQSIFPVMLVVEGVHVSELMAFLDIA